MFHVVHAGFSTRFTLHLGFLLKFLFTELLPSQTDIVSRRMHREQTNDGCSLFSYFYDALSSTLPVTTDHKMLSGWMDPTNRKELNETKRF